MSRKNGNRSRFDLQRKKRMHQRTSIRQLKQTVPAKSAETSKKSETASA